MWLLHFIKYQSKKPGKIWIIHKLNKKYSRNKSKRTGHKEIKNNNKKCSNKTTSC